MDCIKFLHHNMHEILFCQALRAIWHFWVFSDFPGKYTIFRKSNDEVFLCSSRHITYIKIIQKQKIMHQRVKHTGTWRTHTYLHPNSHTDIKWNLTCFSFSKKQNLTNVRSLHSFDKLSQDLYLQLINGCRRFLLRLYLQNAWCWIKPYFFMLKTK